MEKTTIINELKKTELIKSFSNFNDALEFFEVLQQEDKWIERSLKNFSLDVTTPFQTTAFDEATKEQEETAKNAFSYVLSTGTENFILNSDALYSIKSRAGIRGKLLSDLENSGDVMKRKKLTEILNMAWECYPKEKGKILLRSGQILAVHSKGYAPLPQESIFKEVEKYLNDTFTVAEFHHGYYSHNMTEMLFSLAGYKDKIMDAYCDAWKEAGMPDKELKISHPALKFQTSDTAEYCFTISPMFLIGRSAYGIGTPIKLKHKGNANIEDVKEKLQLSFSKVANGITSLSNLFQIEINHPVPCFIRLADEIGLLKSAKNATKSALDFFVGFDEPKSCSAFTLYNALYMVEQVDAFDQLTSSGKLKTSENLSRLLSLDFTKFDKPGRNTI